MSAPVDGATGAPWTGVAARPKVPVVLVQTNARTPHTDALSSSTCVPVTFVSHGAALRPHAAHQCFAEVPGAAGDENGHG